eukprot:scaffold21078_cov112-Isochrysis_galbana.AAC.1
MGHECQVQRARWRRRGGQPGLGWLGLSGPKLGHVSGGADARVSGWLGHVDRASEGLTSTQIRSEFYGGAMRSLAGQVPAARGTFSETGELAHGEWGLGR